MGNDFGKEFVEADYQHIEKICELLEGHPQALSLVIPMTLTSSTSRILEELNQKPLKGIELALDVSFEKLNDNEKDMLKKLSVFRSKFNEDAIKSVCEMNDVLETTKGLRRKSFLQFDEEQYSLHSVIKRYAYYKSNNKKSIHLLAAKYYKNINDSFSQFDQLYAAKKYLKSCKLFESLVNAHLRNIPELDDFTNRISDVIDSSKKADDPRAEFIISKCLGDIYWESGDYEGSFRYYKAYSDYGKLKNIPKWNADGLIFLARNYAFLEDLEKALALQKEALEIVRTLDSKFDLAFILSSSADIYLRLSDLDEVKDKEKCIRTAIKLYKEAAKIIEELEEDDHGLLLLSQVYTNLGVIYSSKSPKKAVTYLENALFLKNTRLVGYDKNDFMGTTICLSNLSDCYELLGDYNRSFNCLNRLIVMGTNNIHIHGLIPHTIAKAAKLFYLKNDQENSKEFFIKACVMVIQEEGVIDEILDLIKENIKELIEKKKNSQAINLVDAIIQFWNENKLAGEFPIVIERIQSIDIKS